MGRVAADRQRFRHSGLRRLRGRCRPAKCARCLSSDGRGVGRRFLPPASRSRRGYWRVKLWTKRALRVIHHLCAESARVRARVRRRALREAPHARGMCSASQFDDAVRIEPMQRARMEPVAVAITGRTRAGKTTLAQLMHEALGWPWSSFSAYVHEVAREREIPTGRRELQELGQALFKELGGAGLARSALELAGFEALPFVIESARHARTVEGLRAVCAAAPVRHIHLDVSDAERNRRLAAEGVSAEEGREWERHPPAQRDALPRRRERAVADAGILTFQAIRGWAISVALGTTCASGANTTCVTPRAEVR